MKSDLKPKYVPVSEDRKKVEVRRRLADVAKAKEMLAWQPKITFEEGIRESFNWYKDFCFGDDQRK